MRVSVGELLSQSRSAHTQFHVTDAVHLGNGHWAKGDQVDAASWLEKALSLRLEAHAADPQHADPAWAQDKVPHAELVAFYQTYLAKLSA